MADVLIFIIIGIIIAYDIFLVIRKRKTITHYMKIYYKKLFIIPFGAGVIFLGHFIDLIPNPFNNTVNLTVMLTFAAAAIVVSCFQFFYLFELKNKWLVLAQVLLGFLVGDLFF